MIHFIKKLIYLASDNRGNAVGIKKNFPAFLNEDTENKVHVCLGSGKTTFLHSLVNHTQTKNIRGYVMNLDPAVMTLPFGANIDIRDTVRYKEVMKQFNLGPNGGILTSLNLFATKFDEVNFACKMSENLWKIFMFLSLFC